MNILWLRIMIIELTQTCIGRSFKRCSSSCVFLHLGRREFGNFAYPNNYSALWYFLPV